MFGLVSFPTKITVPIVSSWIKNMNGCVAWKVTSLPNLSSSWIPAKSNQLHVSEFFLEANSRSYDQEILRCVRKPKVNYRVYEKSPLDHVLSQNTPIHTLLYYCCFKMYVNIILTSVSLSSNWIFSLGFLTDILYEKFNSMKLCNWACERFDTADTKFNPIHIAKISFLGVKQTL